MFIRDDSARQFFLTLLLILQPVPSLVATHEMEFHKLPIHRLSPRVFPKLPRGIVHALESSGYTIPQLWVTKGGDLDGIPHNVIQGSFRKRGHLDWAVLCSRNDSSAIVIFWRGNASDTTMLAHSSDDDWTQSIDEQRNLGYSRLLMVASPNRILRDNPGRKPLHDGIEDYFEGKASSIYYFEQGQLLELEGAD